MAVKDSSGKDKPDTQGIFKRGGRDSYTIVITLPYDKSKGRYPQHWITFRGSLKEARQKRRELLTQVETGTYINPTKTTLAEFVERWLTDYAGANLGPRTVEGYQTIAKQHLIPRLGSHILAKLKPEHIQAYYSKMLREGRHDGSGGLSARTVRHHAMLLHKVFETAVSWGILAKNPVDAVKPPKAAGTAWHPFTGADAREFLESARESHLYPVYYMALFTGMRRSEILALRWCDVDLSRAQAYVNRTLHQLRGGEIVFRPPKSKKGKRMVALSEGTVEVLRKHRAQAETNAALIGVTIPEDGLIFSRVDGSPLRPDAVTKGWHRLAKKCGLEGVRFHDARHWHASALLKAGTHPAVVQSRLGHASISTTIDTYSHVVPGLQEAAVKDIDSLLVVE